MIMRNEERESVSSRMGVFARGGSCVLDVFTELKDIGISAFHVST